MLYIQQWSLTMNYNELYKNFKHIIYFLLKKYNIKYNNDEYVQLLMIKMWELSKVYTPQKSSLNSFLYTRLNYFIIDLFRSQHTIQTYNIFELDNLLILITPSMMLESCIIIFFPIYRKKNNFGSD